MSQYTAWENWIHGNAPIIMLVISLGFGALLWLANRLLTQQRTFHKEKQELKEEIHQNEKQADEVAMDRVADRIGELVEQIKQLFSGQRELNQDLSSVRERVGRVEKRIGEHFTRCNEREKVLVDIKERQDVNIAKFDQALLGGSRKSDKPIDRCDRND